MIVQIICNIIMISAYFAVISSTVYALATLPKKLNNIGKEAIPQGELSQKRTKTYLRTFYLFFLIHLCAVIVSGVTCLLDGLSDTENGLVIPTLISLILTGILTIFFTVYTFILRRKYGLKTSAYSPLSNWRNNGSVDLTIGLLITIMFALNSAFVCYTIQLFFI